MRVAIMGAGAVGGYFGSRLAAAGIDVTLIARGAHLQAIREQGLTVESMSGDYSVRPAATDDTTAVEKVDLILFCVKSYDTEAGVAQIKPMVGENTTILVLQNGVHNEDILAKHFGAECILSGVVYIGAELARPGVIRHESRGEIIFGEPGGALSGRVEAVQELFGRAGIPCTAVADIRARKWQKFLFNCALNAMTAITGCRLSTLIRNQHSHDVFAAAVREVEVLARKEGVDLPADVVEQVLNTAAAMDIRSSMQADLERGRRIELDTFNGHVLTLSRKHGIAAPTHAALYGLLSAMMMKDAG